MNWNELERAIHEIEEELLRPTPEVLADCEERVWTLLRQLSHATVTSAADCPATHTCRRKLAAVTQRARGLSAQYRSGLQALGEAKYDRLGVLATACPSGRWGVEA